MPFPPIWPVSVRFGPFCSGSVRFHPIRSRFHPIRSVLLRFGDIPSDSVPIRSDSVSFNPIRSRFRPIRSDSVRFGTIKSVSFQFGPDSVRFGPRFSPFQSDTVRFGLDSVRLFNLGEKRITRDIITTTVYLLLKLHVQANVTLVPTLPRM